MNRLFYVLLLISTGLSAQTFDFSCDTDVRDILLEFQADYSSFASGTINIEDIEINIQPREELEQLLPEDERPIPPDARGFAYLCGNRAVVYYVKEWYDVSSYYQKRRVIYHEIGHSLFDYLHPCTYQRHPDGYGCSVSVSSGFIFRHDIMGYGDIPEDLWDRALESFFSGRYHDIAPCSSRKGRTIIID